MQYYNPDWDMLPYFVSSQETAFELAMLKKFDGELLIGQTSYKQKADMYNYFHGYEDVTKKVLPLKKSPVVLRYVLHYTM